MLQNSPLFLAYWPASGVIELVYIGGTTSYNQPCFCVSSVGPRMVFPPFLLAEPPKTRKPPEKKNIHIQWE